MLIPEPRPGELAKGFLGYVMRINGKTNYPEFVKILNHEYGGASDGRSAIPLAHVLANAAGLSPKAFIPAHTMMPLICAVSLQPKAIPFDDARMAKSTVIRAFVSARRKIHVCEVCVTEDIQFWGVPYYRRLHQLPGVFCCEKHGTQLLAIDDQSAALRCPESLLGDARSDSSKNQGGYRHPMVQRFLQISEALLVRQTPIYGGNLAEIFQDRARELRGVDITKTGRYLLGDYVLKKFPKPWLNMLLSDISLRNFGELSRSLDAVMSTQSGAFRRSVFFVLAMAALFDDLSDVLARVPGQRSGLAELQADASNRAIAEGEISVDSFLRQQGYHLAGKELNRVRSAFDQFSRGGSVLAASQDNGVSVADLEHLLRKVAQACFGRSTGSAVH